MLNDIQHRNKNATFGLNDSRHNDTYHKHYIALPSKSRHAEWRYADSHYTECRYSDCPGAINQPIFNEMSMAAAAQSFALILTDSQWWRLMTLTPAANVIKPFTAVIYEFL